MLEETYYIKYIPIQEEDPEWRELQDNSLAPACRAEVCEPTDEGAKKVVVSKGKWTKEDEENLSYLNLDLDY